MMMIRMDVKGGMLEKQKKLMLLIETSSLNKTSHPLSIH